MDLIESHEKWQEDSLVLIGSTNYEYVTSLESFIQNRDFVWSAWSFRIREEWRNTILNRLKTDGKFPIFFYLAKGRGGSGTVENVAIVSDILISDTPVKTPDPDNTNIGEEEYPTDWFKSYTWLKFSEIEPLDLIDLGIFRDIDAEDPMVPSQLRSAFGYAYLPDNFEEIIAEKKPVAATSISVEKDLRKYIVANLDSIEEGLMLYEKEGKSGEEYPIETGKMRIDILALDKEKKHVVIELKAGTANIDTFGQISAYMGWINQSFTKKEKVRGIIVANNFDEKIKYAVSLIPDIALKQYELKFNFRDV